MNWFECLFIGCAAAIITIVLLPAARIIAVRLDAIDYPGERRVNKRPVPRMGGIALIGGFLGAVAFSLVGSMCLGWVNPFESDPRLHVNHALSTLALIVMFGIGLADDAYDLRPRVKFVGQIIAACMMAASGVLLSEIANPFGPGEISLGWLAYPITVFYLVAFANVINLIDGLDGLAAGITAISSLTLFVFTILTGRIDATIFSIALAGACIGFLKDNYHPAKIFMGDSGALFLGFTLGSISLLAVARSTFFVSLLVPILAAAIPILDTAGSIIRRKRAHQPIDQADKGHIHHRLLAAGFSQRTTVLIMWGLTVLFSVAGVIIVEFDGISRYLLFIAILIVLGVIVWRLHLLDPVLVHHYTPRVKKEDAQEVSEDNKRIEWPHR